MKIRGTLNCIGQRKFPTKLSILPANTAHEKIGKDAVAPRSEGRSPNRKIGGREGHGVRAFAFLLQKGGFPAAKLCTVRIPRHSNDEATHIF
jgi:hypothetical protein